MEKITPRSPQSESESYVKIRIKERPISKTIGLNEIKKTFDIFLEKSLYILLTSF